MHVHLLSLVWSALQEDSKMEIYKTDDNMQADNLSAHKHEKCI